MNKNLELMSMEELSRFANNQGEDIVFRRKALEMLDRRETRLFSRHYTYGKCVAKNYVDGL